MPPIRREDVRGFLKRRALWWSPNLDLDRMRGEAEVMELQAASFYDRAAEQAADVSVRELFAHLAEVERGHEKQGRRIRPDAYHRRRGNRGKRSGARLFVLQYVQPGLAGLIDGSVSTLAPLFAAAFATRANLRPSWSASRPRSAPASPWASRRRSPTTAQSPGAARRSCAASSAALMTALGGLGHTLPYLVPDAWPNAFALATGVAVLVVAVELLAISYDPHALHGRRRSCGAALQVILGGVLVLLAGISSAALDRRRVRTAGPTAHAPACSASPI